MPGAEGRKDPFQAMYSFMPEAPETTVYDFACSLAEYCLSREPTFFSSWRAFIDKFHYAGHKARACGNTFRTTRIPEVGQWNDSGAEQFHAFADYLARHMTSMSLFRLMFTLQLSYRMWSDRKVAAARNAQKNWVIECGNDDVGADEEKESSGEEEKDEGVFDWGVEDVAADDDN